MARSVLILEISMHPILDNAREKLYPNFQFVFPLLLFYVQWLTFFLPLSFLNGNL